PCPPRGAGRLEWLAPDRWLRLGLPASPQSLHAACGRHVASRRHPARGRLRSRRRRVARAGDPAVRGRGPFASRLRRPAAVCSLNGGANTAPAAEKADTSAASDKIQPPGEKRRTVFPITLPADLSAYIRQSQKWSR